MTAKGKINAANVQINDRIIVTRRTAIDAGITGTVGALVPSDRKTGDDVLVVRVVSKSYVIVQGGRRDRRVYVIETSAGTFECAPIQTMILAPEDAAGIKRAFVEALAEDTERATEREALAEDFRTSGALDDAHTEALAAKDEQRWTLGDILTVHEMALTEDRERELVANEAEMQRRAWVETVSDRVFTTGINRASAERTLIDEAHAEALTLHSQDGKVDNMSRYALTERQIEENAAQSEAENLADAEVAREENEAPGGIYSSEDHTGSTVVSLLEKVWARIRADHPELPEVVIITGSGLVGASKWGHFRAEGWKVREEGAAVRKHELFLAGEALAKGARQVLQTMLHEGAHTLARVRGQQDTSRQGRWHNATFRKLAEEMGLEHKPAQADKSNGFSFVTLTTATADRYADLLAELDRKIRLVCHLPVWLGGEAGQDEAEGGEKITGKPKGEGETKPHSGSQKATCQCAEPVIIRLSQKTLDLGVVRCDSCGFLFKSS